MKSFTRAAVARSRERLYRLENVVMGCMMVILAVMPLVSLIALIAGHPHVTIF